MSCPVLALGLAGAVVGLAAAEAVPPLTRAKPAPPIPKDPRTTPAPMAVFFTLELHLFFMSISPVSGRVPNWASVWGYSALPVRPACLPVSHRLVRAPCWRCDGSMSDRARPLIGGDRSPD